MTLSTDNDNLSGRTIQALFFDIDDTFYSTTEFAAVARRRAMQNLMRLGVKLDEEELLREFLEVVEEFGSNDSRHFDRLLQRLPSEVYAGANRSLLIAGGMVGYHNTKIREMSPYEDGLEVLKELKKRNLRMGIITAGTTLKQAEKIIRLGLDNYVDHQLIFITDEIGIAKTNPKIFLRACQAAGVEPSLCGYVGDNPKVDVDVPHQAGLRTFLSRRSGKYLNTHGLVTPDHIIHNFWDLLEILEHLYGI